LLVVQLIRLRVMVKVLTLSLLTLTCVMAARERGLSLDMHAENKPEDDAKCHAACPGTHASKLGWLFGGTEECECEDASQVIADQHGEVQWSYEASLDSNYSSFKYEKKGFFRDSKCMPRNDRVYRQAFVDIQTALSYKKDHTAGFQFLGVSYNAQALATFASAARGDSRKTLARGEFLRGFECSGRKFRTPELDEACADGMVAIKQHYQSEASACLEAVSGLESAKEFVDGAAFTEAATLVSQAAKILASTNSRDDAKDKAGEARTAMDGILQSLFPKVKGSIPPF